MGKGKDISPRKVAVVNTLLSEGRYSQRQIAHKVSLSQKSVSRISVELRKNATYRQNRVGKCGRKSNLSPRGIRTLKNMALLNRKCTSKELSIKMAGYGAVVPPGSVRRILCSEGIKSCRPRKKAKITPSMAQSRLEWAKGLQHWSEEWEKVCFSDESYFSISEECSRYVRRRRGEEYKLECIQQTVKHPTAVMVWGVMSIHGPGRIQIVEGTMKQDNYKQVLEEQLLPQAEEWFDDGSFIFMHDSAPCHKAKSVTTFLKEKDISVLPWPGNSPDMNPIENVWSFMKHKLMKKNITNKHQLIAEINNLWYTDVELKDMCVNLVKSMPKRLKSVIQRKGYHTKY